MDNGPKGWQPDDVACYLYYGYLPRLPKDIESLPGWGVELDQEFAERSHDDLVSIGIDSFAAAFDECPDGPHVVPLSGGLDSRAILAELCTRVPSSSITAITVGVPGSLDFEISAEVASRVGVEHVRIDLAQHEVTAESLEVVAATNDRPTWVFDAYFNRLMRDFAGTEAVYWSGYLGSRLSSSKHLSPNPQISFEEALQRFVEANRWSRTVQLVPQSAALRTHLPEAPLSASNALGHDEQLDLWIRQQNLTRPVNLPAGFRHRAPFTDTELVSFFLSIPRQDSNRQRVYRDMLLRAYPKLFCLPTTANSGLALQPTGSSQRRWQVARISRAVTRRILRGAPAVWQTNYLDFDHALRHRDDYRLLSRNTLQRLAERGITPWLDIESLWNAHQRREADHALALLLLVSLEIHHGVAAATR